MIEPNTAKLAFSRYMTDLSDGFITSDVCHNYGIMDGCDEGCPALLAGDCEQPEDAIENCDFTEDERKEVLSLYDKPLDTESK